MKLKNISPFSTLEESNLKLLNDLMKKKIFKKQSTLIEQGDFANHIIFLTSGIVASIYQIKSKQFVRDFYFDPMIFTEQESFEKQIPSRFSVVSVTDIKCKLISRTDLETAYDTIPSLRNVAYKLLFNGFVNISRRLETLLTLNPEQRYLKLLNENPKLLQKIPLKMIASYLGITDVALSRIRKRISRPTKN